MPKMKPLLNVILASIFFILLFFYLLFSPYFFFICLLFMFKIFVRIKWNMIGNAFVYYDRNYLSNCNYFDYFMDWIKPSIMILLLSLYFFTFLFHSSYLPLLYYLDIPLPIPSYLTITKKPWEPSVKERKEELLKEMNRSVQQEFELACMTVDEERVRGLLIGMPSINSEAFVCIFLSSLLSLSISPLFLLPLSPFPLIFPLIYFLSFLSLSSPHLSTSLIANNLLS